MRAIPRPAFDVSTVLPRLAIRDDDLRTRITQAKSALVDEESRYVKHAESGRLHQIEKRCPLDLSDDELTGMYQRLRDSNKASNPGGASARQLYMKLLVGATNGTCPFCGSGAVSTLDHFLPRIGFARFAVTPSNLVPACRDCNNNKRTFAGSAAEDVPIHPYFDDVERLNRDRWLHASVKWAQPAAPSVRFEVHPPTSWSDIDQARVKRHFEVFNLAEAYTVRAAQEMIDIKAFLSGRDIQGDSVQKYLLDQYDSRKSAHMNSWAAACYLALSGDPTFIDGGYNRVGT